MQPDDLHEEVLTQLGNVVCPCATAEGYTEYGIDDMGLVKSLEKDGAELRVDLRLIGPGCLKIGYLRYEIDKHVTEISEIESVTVTTDNGLEWRPDMMSEEFKEVRRERVQKTLEDADLPTQ